jgi:hypothetical protein
LAPRDRKRNRRLSLIQFSASRHKAEGVVTAIDSQLRSMGGRKDTAQSFVFYNYSLLQGICGRPVENSTSKLNDFLLNIPMICKDFFF